MERMVLFMDGLSPLWPGACLHGKWFGPGRARRETAREGTSLDSPLRDSFPVKGSPVSDISRHRLPDNHRDRLGM